MGKTVRRLCNLVFGLSIMLAIPLSASAEDAKTMCPICKKANDETASYQSKTSSTLVRGLTNTALGWTDLIRQPAAEVKQGTNVVTALAHGVGKSVTRTVSGVGELLTFWMPKVQGRYVHFSQDCPICRGKQR